MARRLSICSLCLPVDVLCSQLVAKFSLVDEDVRSLTLSMSHKAPATKAAAVPPSSTRTDGHATCSVLICKHDTRTRTHTGSRTHVHTSARAHTHTHECTHRERQDTVTTDSLFKELDALRETFDELLAPIQAEANCGPSRPVAQSLL